MAKPHVSVSTGGVSVRHPSIDSSTWSGYWTFMVLTILFMFIIFTVKKGTFGTWLSFFSWTQPATNTATSTNTGAGTSTSTTNTIAGAITTALGAGSPVTQSGAGSPTLNTGAGNLLQGLPTSMSQFLGPTLSGILGVK